MSTSEQLPLSTGIPETANWATPLHASEGLTPGLPTPAELGRIANELFNALPGSLQQPVASAAAVVLPPNSAFSGNPYAAVPSPTAPAVPGAASGVLASAADAQPGPFVATPDRSIAPDLRPAAPAAPVSTIPGGGVAGGTAPTAGPAFAFLQDARPLFVEPDAEPAAQNTPSQAFGSPVPADEGFASIPATLFPDLQPAQAAQPPQPPSPTVPGALGVVDSSAIQAFSFLVRHRRNRRPAKHETWSRVVHPTIEECRWHRGRDFLGAQQPVF